MSFSKHMATWPDLSNAITADNYNFGQVHAENSNKPLIFVFK